MVEEMRNCKGRLALGACAVRMETTGATQRQRLARRNAKTRTDVARVSGSAPQHGDGRRNLEVDHGGLRRRGLRSNVAIEPPSELAKPACEGPPRMDG